MRWTVRELGVDVNGRVCTRHACVNVVAVSGRRDRMP